MDSPQCESGLTAALRPLLRLLSQGLHRRLLVPQHNGQPTGVFMHHFVFGTLVSPQCGYDFSDHNSYFFLTSHCSQKEVWTNHAMSECAGPVL